MQWLVDIDTAVVDGILTVDSGGELKRRAREAMVAYAINLALFAGIMMVIGGAAAWLEDRRALGALGAALAVFGTLTLVYGGPRVRLVANATAIIGVTLAIGAFADLLFEGRTQRVFIGSALGLPAVAVGWVMHRLSPASLSILGGWILLLGAAVHVGGILTTESELGLEWMVLHYAGAVAIACGFVLDVRFVTALAIVPLAAALSSRTFYEHAIYGVTIYEATLTILQMSLFAALAFLVTLHFGERIARHARTIGQLALIWVNMAFWIGSLWGDVVGFYLWHARSDQALTISADIFAALWALGILAVGAWGAFTGRRAVLNISVTFGAIHFYTQYFERLESTPEAITTAGVIAIFVAWALWAFNRQLARREVTTYTAAT